MDWLFSQFPNRRFAGFWLLLLPDIWFGAAEMNNTQRASAEQLNYQLPRILRPSSRKMPLKFISSACGLLALAIASFCVTFPSFTS